MTTSAKRILMIVYWRELVCRPVLQRQKHDITALGVQKHELHLLPLILQSRPTCPAKR